MPTLGEANAVNVEATGGRAHYVDGVSEPYKVRYPVLEGEAKVESLRMGAGLR